MQISRNDDEETVREILEMNVLEIIDDEGSEVAKKRKESVAVFNNQVRELRTIRVLQRPNPRNDLRDFVLWNFQKHEFPNSRKPIKIIMVEQFLFSTFEIAV